MGIVSTIIKKGFLDKNYPRESPVFSLDKEQQLKLNQGECLLVTDKYYKSRWIVRKIDLSVNVLTKENIDISPGDNMSLNSVRQQELENFYSKNTQYKR